MTLAHRVRLTLLVVATLVIVAYPQIANDDPELTLGCKALKAARYEEAIQHFKRAVANSPQSTKAHLYLATAYMQEVIPGSSDPDNHQNGQQAIAQYREALQLEPQHRDAILGLAYLYLQMKEFEEAKIYYGRAIEVDPKDPEPYYSIGVIDWTVAYQRRMEVRAKLGLRPEKPLIGDPECSEVRSANEQLVVDGIDKLKEALQLRRDYDDAMAYMNLMYRKRADIQCGDPKARAADAGTADKWVDLTMAVKKAKASGRPLKDSNAEKAIEEQQQSIEK